MADIFSALNRYFIIIIAIFLQDKTPPGLFVQHGRRWVSLRETHPARPVFVTQLNDKPGYDESAATSFAPPAAPAIVELRGGRAKAHRRAVPLVQRFLRLCLDPTSPFDRVSKAV